LSWSGGEDGGRLDLELFFDGCDWYGCVSQASSWSGRQGGWFTLLSEGGNLFIKLLRLGRWVFLGHDEVVSRTLPAIIILNGGCWLVKVDGRLQLGQGWRAMTRAQRVVYSDKVLVISDKRLVDKRDRICRLWGGGGGLPADSAAHMARINGPWPRGWALLSGVDKALKNGGSPPPGLHGQTVNRAKSAKSASYLYTCTCIPKEKGRRPREEEFVMPSLRRDDEKMYLMNKVLLVLP
jgi:hypothetical protein